MNLGSLVAESLVSLRKNKIRTALSMLGIIIGVGAVITLVAMAQATQTRIQDEITRMGDDWMMVGYWGMGHGGVRKGDVERKPQQTKEDAQAIVEQCSAVRAATPTNAMSLPVKSSYNNYQTFVMGAYPCYHDIRRWNVDAGRNLNDTDEANCAAVCCIGLTATRELFGSVNPVGEEITVKNSRFKVVGVLSFKGQDSHRDSDDIILFPYMTYQRKVAGSEVSGSMLVAARIGVDPKAAENQVRNLLRQRHSLREEDADDFRIRSVSESAALKEESSDSFDWLLRMVAGVSLVVGGIGIMNIMLVSVT